jgi:hypothetical protein
MNWLRKWFYSGLSTGGFWIAKKLGYQFVLLGVISALLVEGVYRKDYSTGIEIDVLLIAVCYIGFQVLFNRLSKLLLTDYGYLGALRRFGIFVLAFITLLLLQYSWPIDHPLILRLLKIVNLSIVFPIITGFKSILEVQSAQLFSVNKKQGLADVPDFNRININRTIYSVSIVGTLIFIDWFLSDMFLPQDYLWITTFGILWLFRFNLTDNIKSGNHGLAIQEIKPPNVIKKNSVYLSSNYFRLIYLSTLILLIFTASVFSMELEKLTLNHDKNFQRFITLVIWLNVFAVIYQEFGKTQLRRIKTTVSVIIIPVLTLLFSIILVANRVFGVEQSLFYNFSISVLFIIVWVGGANISEAMLDVALNHCSAAEKFATRRILTGFKIRFLAVGIILIPVILRYFPGFSFYVPVNEFLIYSSLILSLVWVNLSKGIATLYKNRFTTLKENLQLSAVGYQSNNNNTAKDIPQSNIVDNLSVDPSEKANTELEFPSTDSLKSREIDENLAEFNDTENSSQLLSSSSAGEPGYLNNLESAFDNTLGSDLDKESVGIKVLPPSIYYERFTVLNSSSSELTISSNEIDRPKSPYKNLLQILSENGDFASLVVNDENLDHNPENIDEFVEEGELQTQISHIEYLQHDEIMEDEIAVVSSTSVAEAINNEEEFLRTVDVDYEEEIVEESIISGNRVIDLGRLLNSNELSSQFQAIEIIRSNKYSITDILTLISYSPVALRNQIFKQWDQQTIIHTEHDLYPKFVGLLKDTSELLVWLQINISEIHGQSVEDLFMLSNMYHLSKQVQIQIIQILSFNLGIHGAQRVENYLNNIETDTDVIFNLELLGEILPPAVKPYLLPIYEPTTFAQKIDQWRQLIPLFSGDLNERYLDIALKDFSLIPVSIKFWALRILHKKHYNPEKLTAFRKSNITSLRAAVSSSSSKFGTTIERFIGKAELKSVEDVFIGSEILVDWLNSFESEKKLRDSKEHPEMIFNQRRALIKKYIV